MKKIYSIVIDTETAPITQTTEVNPYNMLTYDIGYIVTDRQGNIYKQNSFVVYDIFVGEKQKMQSAYYSNKLPQYEIDLKNKIRIMKRFLNIKNEILKDIKDFGVTEIYAHNMRFDYGALNNTLRYLSNYKYFFPKDVKICDTLKMSRQVLNTPKYKKFCVDNGYMTKNNQPRFTAEILYRFITKDNSFIESHTALEDVLIEKEILKACFKKHKKMNKELW